MNNRLASFGLLGLRCNQAAIACRDASQLEVAAIGSWISRYVTAWESIKTAVDVPTAISTGIDVALTEAIRQAGVLPTCDADSIMDNVEIIGNLIRTSNEMLHTFVKRVSADQESTQDAFLLGWRLADLEDPELTQWRAGDDNSSPTMPEVEELLQRSDMTLDDVLGDVSDADELLEGELPSMRCGNWSRLETGLVARCQPGLSDPASSGQENERLTLQNPKIQLAARKYGIRLNSDYSVERQRSRHRVKLQAREFKLLLHFLDRGDNLTSVEWFRRNWRSFGRDATCAPNTVYSAISGLNESLSRIELDVKAFPDGQGWVLDDLRQKPVS